MIIGNFNVDDEIATTMKRLHDQIDGIRIHRFKLGERLFYLKLMSNQPLFGKGAYMECRFQSDEILFVLKEKR